MNHNLIHLMVCTNPKLSFAVSWMMVAISFLGNLSALEHTLTGGLQITASLFAIWTSIEVRKYYRDKRKQLKK